MKNKFRLYICLLILAVFSASCCAASADSALDTILKTGTTQSFTTDAVPEDDIQSILRAGVSTASSINQQPWYFVAITNQELMKEIGSTAVGFFMFFCSLRGGELIDRGPVFRYHVSGSGTGTIQ